MPFLSQNIVHDLSSWSGLLEFRLCWQWSVPPLHGLLLQFRGFKLHPCLVPCDYMVQEVFAFLTVLCQKVQCTGLPFQFVFFCKQLRHPVCTQFPKLKFLTQFREEVTMKFEEMQGKWHNDESSVFSNFLFNCTHKIFNPNRQSSITQIIVHIYASLLNNCIHLRTIELLIACSPQTSQSRQWISPGFMFFTFKKRITDRISHAVGFSIFLNIINTQHDA